MSMLHFTKAVMTLDSLGKACEGYSILINALENREPTWQEFTAWLLKEGYAEADPEISQDEIDELMKRATDGK